MIATLATRAAADGHRRRGRHRRPRLVPARLRPAHQGPLQQARRLRLRALRRSGHRRAVRRRHARAVPASTRRCAATRATTCPAFPGSARRPRPSSSPPTASLEGIFEHLDELPPKQRQNLGEAHDRVFKNREMSVLDREVEVGVEPKRARCSARSTSSACACCSTSSSSARCCRASSTRSAPADAVAEGRRGRGVRRRGRDRARRRRRDRRARRPRQGAARSRSSRAGRGAAGRSDLVAASCSADGRRVTYVDAELLATPKVRAELEALCGAPEAGRRRAPREGARARPARRPALARARHRAHGVPPRSGRGEVRARGSRAPLPLDRADLARPRRGHARSRRRRGRRRHAASRRVLVPRLADALEEAMQARELVDLYERIELPLVRVLAPHGGRRHPHRPRIPERARQGAQRRVPPARGRDPPARGRAVQRELHAAAPAHPLREARAHAGEEDEDRDRRPTPTRCRSWPKSTRSSSRCCATARSRSCGAPTPTRCRRSLAADGRIHATFNQLATTTGRISSESPNLQNVPVRTAGGRELRRAFIADDGCGLLTADYSQIELRVLAHLADDPGLIEAFERGADVHTTTASQGVRRRRGEGRPVPAPVREGRQLRPRLRHGGLRARAAPRHPHRSGARDPRRVLRRVPERRRLHAGDDPRGEVLRATRPRCSAAAANCPSCRRTTSASARWGSGWRRTRRCRAPRPTSSSSR